MDRSQRKITETYESAINLHLPPSVQRATLLYQWFRTMPVVESGKIIICR